jgi:hypothetical protein
MEVLVEGHTDNVPISQGLHQGQLGPQRAAGHGHHPRAQKDYGVDPARITAGGRAEYVPLANSDTPEARSTNRRTRIVILPKLDQFYDMIEDGLKGPRLQRGSVSSTRSPVSMAVGSIGTLRSYLSSTWIPTAFRFRKKITSTPTFPA